MKKLFIAIVVVALTFTTITAFAQSAIEAIMALKKLETLSQSGISYKEYSSALSDAKFVVNLFLESKESSKNRELTESISRAMKHYETAWTYWNYEFSIWKYGVSKEQESEVIKKYPDAAKNYKEGGAYSTKGDYMLPDFLMPIVWKEASKELGNASKLYSQIEGEASNDIEKLKKENAELKAENEKLKKQLELIKSKRKK